MDSSNVTHGRERWKILLMTVLATFMSTLDSSKVNVALPNMAKALNVDTGDIAWVINSYLIVITISILIFGRLGDLKGQFKIFRYGILIFTGGSLLCGLTKTLPLLIAARAVQAIGAAATMANSQGIITRTFPPEERGRALGISGTFVALGSMVGPSLGGFLISVASWEYLFFINVPIGILIFIANLKFVKVEETKSDEKLDVLGGVLFSLAIVPFFLAIDLGKNYGYSHPLILAMFAVAIAAFVWFILTEKRSKMPLLDIRIFSNSWYSISIFCAFTSFVAMACSNLVLPFYLQNTLCMGPAQAGLYMSIYPIVLSVVAPLSGYLSDKIGSEVLTLIGLTLTSTGFFLMATLTEVPVYWLIVLYIGLMSLGNGLFQSPNNSLVMSMVPRDKLGIGGSVNALVRNFGFSIGIALATFLLYGGMSAKLGYRVTDYISGRHDAFIFGMRLTYIAAGSICLIGALLTAFRLYKRKKQLKPAADDNC